MDTMSNISKETRIEELEADIVEAEKTVELGEYLKELKRDKRFQAVIINGYIGELAEYLFNELTKSISLHSQPEDQLKEGLLAIRHLKSYIGFDGLPGDIEYHAMKAKDDILDIEEKLSKL